MSFKTVVPPRSKRLPKAMQILWYKGIEIILSPQTVFLLGAVLQGLLILLLPKKYAIGPAILLLSIHTFDTFLVTRGLKANPYLRGAIPNKSTAQVLDKDGYYSGPGEEKIAILLLGSKSNHPMGVLAPDFSKMGNHLNQMIKELQAEDSQDTGFLGLSGWTGKDANGAQELLTISYWRSLDDIYRFAHGPTHKKAWLWWNRTLAEHGHIGVMHELFEAPRGMWESLYVNWQPTLMGSNSYLKRKDDGSREWASGLMDANLGLLRTSNGRRGQMEGGMGKDQFGKNNYKE